ncbi:unnamed protein product [Adineta ricciae]|uniref:RNA-dependent RNA polymerase n=1 Tax=Adineta ricciae TaxID=249248 RepID=A0A814PHN8_ADIRI|nr:unnamed protein product [Adineta ricciae]
MAGCKGLLVVDPASSTNDFYIKIRPTMQKFRCNDWTLEICEHSVATPTRLNNQIILLMSDLGVPDETFLRLQKKWFDNAPSKYIYADNLLKNKIPLPVNECRYMFGCAFETKLEAGTCFIRYEVLGENKKPLPNRQYKSVEGKVIVTKNPCPYAGDMLVLNAVDLPELRDLHDVIVFSTKGDRPDFHKIAGSDLDGDKYFVYWGSELQLRSSVPPLDYTADKKIKHPTPISAEDVINYYLSTLGATSYGEVFNLHTVIVDRNEEKHSQRTCQKLAIEMARMFASAIDSGKTGYTIDKNRIQTIRNEYGKCYPDFLMKYDKSFYKSQSIVGILYRNARLFNKKDFESLANAFACLTTQDDGSAVSTSPPLASLPVNTTSVRVKSGGKRSSSNASSKPNSKKK